MKRLSLLTLVALLQIAGYSSAQQAVPSKGVTPKLKIEEVISGYLTDLNGKYKLSVTEVTFEPGGFVGENIHLVDLSLGRRKFYLQPAI